MFTNNDSTRKQCFNLKQKQKTHNGCSVSKGERPCSFWHLIVKPPGCLSLEVFRANQIVGRSQDSEHIIPLIWPEKASVSPQEELETVAKRVFSRDDVKSRILCTFLVSFGSTFSPVVTEVS